MGLKYIVLLLLPLFSQSLLAQQNKDSVEVYIIVKDQHTKEALKNAVIKVYNGRTHGLVEEYMTDSSGTYVFKLNRSESENTVFNIVISQCARMSNTVQVFIDNTNTHWQEVFLVKGCILPIPNILFHKNEFDKTVYSYEEKLIKNFLLENPTVKITLVGRYNFDEDRKVASKRLEYLKKILAEEFINYERVGFEVMDSDYVYYNLNDDCDTVFYDRDRFFNADTNELKVFESNYQCVDIRIDTWDYKPKKYKCNITLLVRDMNTGAPIPKASIETKINGSYYRSFTANRNGLVNFKLQFDSLKDSLSFLTKHKDYNSLKEQTFQLKNNYDFYQEIYLYKEKNFVISCGPFIYPEKDFVFEDNKVELSDSLESRNFRFLADFMIENPTTIIQAKALYNFNESVSVARQRLDYFKSKLKDYKINPDRILFKVMKEEYEQDYYGDSSEMYITLNKANYQNASREEKAVYAQKFQRIKITIVSWDYKPEDHE